MTTQTAINSVSVSTSKAIEGIRKERQGSQTKETYVLNSLLLVAKTAIENQDKRVLAAIRDCLTTTDTELRRDHKNHILVAAGVAIWELDSDYAQDSSAIEHLTDEDKVAIVFNPDVFSKADCVTEPRQNGPDVVKVPAFDKFVAAAMKLLPVVMAVMSKWENSSESVTMDDLLKLGRSGSRQVMRINAWFLMDDDNRKANSPEKCPEFAIDGGHGFGHCGMSEVVKQARALMQIKTRAKSGSKARVTENDPTKIKLETVADVLCLQAIKSDDPVNGDTRTALLDGVFAMFERRLGLANADSSDLDIDALKSEYAAYVARGIAKEEQQAEADADAAAKAEEQAA